jgi:N-acylglucosamine 2-epimerase
MSLDLGKLEGMYRSALLEDVIPFWERHSMDSECGGYFTCLDRAGRVFDTDKFMWPQGRQVWMFSKLYNELERREEWLEMARLGAAFLERYGRDESGDWYFSLTREGEPLVQAYNWFSDSFAAIGFGQYAWASGEGRAAEIARQTFARMLARLPNPKGRYNKLVPGIRPLQSMAFPMILINVCRELAGVVEADRLERTSEQAIREIMNLHLDRERGITIDNIGPNGSQVDCFEGRSIIPGHGIEAMWFVMDAVEEKKDRQTIETAVETILKLLDFGWDEEYGGILYYRDIAGKPPLQLEWDQKLWWVHVEALVALVMGYRLTGRRECLEWFEKVHAYTWERFADPQYGEWFGYLNRRGEVLIDLKGGKWKGCFHLPRGLWRCWQELSRLRQAGRAG